MNEHGAALQQRTETFFERAQVRLTLDVPPALTDPSAQGERRGDLDLDPVLWERAGVKATKPAAVLVPVNPPRPTVRLFTQRTAPGAASHARTVVAISQAADQTRTMRVR